MQTPSSGGSPSGTLDMVVFHAGGQRYALEASEVIAMAPPSLAEKQEEKDGKNPAPQPIEEFLSLPLSTEIANQSKGLGCKRVLLLKNGQSLLVSEPIELKSLPHGNIRPLPPMVSARVQVTALRAFGLDGSDLLFLLTF